MLQPGKMQEIAEKIIQTELQIVALQEIRRWEDDVRNDLGSMGVENWKQKVQEGNDGKK